VPEPRARRPAPPRRQARARQAPHARRRRRGTVITAFVAVAAVALLFTFVYPTRSFLDQRASIKDAHARLEFLRSENARLAKQAQKLSDDAEIEKLAREQYGLVKPGEQSFVILPAPTTTTAPPAPGSTTTTTP
jgi:cell division protein FtsB